MFVINRLFVGRRILPVIDAELRKKVEMANKAKDARAKKALKSPEISIEKDSFDLEEMSHNKSLYERLGLDSPVKGAAKKKSPAKKKDSTEGDSIKPTKLKFDSAATKKKDHKDDDADHDSEKDEFDLMVDSAPLRYDIQFVPTSIHTICLSYIINCVFKCSMSL